MFGRRATEEPPDPSEMEQLREQMGFLIIAAEQTSKRNEKAASALAKSVDNLTKAVNKLNTTMERSTRSRKW
jgi:hypothetical protein